MYEKLFQLTLVLFVVIVSIAFFAILLTGIFSMLQPQDLARTYGIGASAGGLSVGRFSLLAVAAALAIGGIYLLRRRRKIDR